jgi:hypothetical protein
VKTLSKLSLSLIALLLYFVVPTLLLLNVVHSFLFEDQMISNSLEKTGLYESTSATLVSDFSVKREDFIDENSREYAYAKDKIDAKVDKYVSVINTAIEQSITPTWVGEKFKGLEEELLLAIKGEGNLSFAINISDLKASILEKFDASFTEEEKNEKIHQDIRASLTELPTELTSQEAGVNLEAISTIQTYYSEYDQTNRTLWIAMITLISIGALIAFLSKTFFRWLGTTTTSIGVSIVLYFAATKYFPIILEKLNMPIPTIGNVSNENIETVLFYITTTIADKLLPFAIAVTSSGLVLLAISYIPTLSPKETKTEKTA